MSRKRIVAHVEAAGWTVDSLAWEYEMSGDLAWYGIAYKGDREAEIMGYNWHQAIAFFDNEASGDHSRDPFACSGKMVRAPGDCRLPLGHRGPHEPQQ